MSPDLVRRLNHEIIWVAVGQVLTFTGSFVGIKLLTTYLGAAGYGQLSIGLTIAGVINIFLFGPLGQVIIRYYAVCRERDELPLYFQFSRQTHLYLLIGLLGLALVAAPVVAVYAGRAWGWLTATAIAFGLVTGVNASLISLQSAVRQRKVVALHQGADSWLRTLLALVLVYFVLNSGYTAMLGYLFGAILVTSSQLYYAYRKPEVRPLFTHQVVPVVCQSPFREFWSYAASFVIFAGFAAISSYADRWMLQVANSIQEVGIYTALYQIANAPVILLVGVINQYIVPILFEKAGAMTRREQGRESARLLLKTVLATALLLAVVMLVAAVGGEWIVRTLTTSEIAAHHTILWKLVLGIGLFNIGQLLVLNGLNHNRPDIYITPKALQAVVFVLFGIFLARRFGMEGMALALCLSAALYVVAVLVVNSRLKAPDA